MGTEAWNKERERVEKLEQQKQHKNQYQKHYRAKKAEQRKAGQPVLGDVRRTADDAYKLAMELKEQVTMISSIVFQLNNRVEELFNAVQQQQKQQQQQQKQQQEQQQLPDLLVAQPLEEVDPESWLGE